MFSHSSTCFPGRTVTGLAALALLATAAHAHSHAPALEAIVITAPDYPGPLELRTDPRAARQPFPAQDGADFLATLPGFAQIRKGGAAGDLLFRGMSGSRVGILLDGQEIYGGCGMRMDPPTAYVHPAAFDVLTITKGPQSVLHGAGQFAASAHFGHQYQRPAHFSVAGTLSATAAQAARHEQSADFRASGPQYYLRGSGVQARAKDYRDGSGARVHSRYRRWSGYAALGWTPDADTRLELSANAADGEAAAANSPMMDGSQYRRENLSVLLEKQRLTPWLDELQLRLYHNRSDHVMDNFSLRPTPSGRYMVSNPDRLLRGARIQTRISPETQHWELTLGAERITDQHRSRLSGPRASAEEARAAYRARQRGHNLRFARSGWFGELRNHLPQAMQLVTGLRLDQHQVRDQRQTSTSHGQSERRNLPGGFARWEKHAPRGHVYAGLGHAQRFPDFWERIKTDANGVESAAVRVAPEKLTQIDVGGQYGQYERDGQRLNISAFYGHIHDYVLLWWPDDGTPARSLNVDARTFGLELEAQYRLHPHWSLLAGMDWVRGSNRTQRQPLAQQPPLQVRLGLERERGQWSAGLLWRAAMRQKRFHLNHGGIASRDNGPTPGFGVLALHAGWRAGAALDGLHLTAGVDNLLDKTYAQHLSKTGGGPGIWPGGQRIHEPGRTWWIQGRWEF